MKKISNLFLVLSVLLSDVMCAHVAYRYCKIQYGIKYEGYTAIPELAFLYVVPYLIGVVACIIVAVKLRKKEMLKAEWHG